MSTKAALVGWPAEAPTRDGRTDRIARAYAQALAAARAAREQGDTDGYRYAMKDAHRLGRALGV